ncbi:MAG: glucose-6-phosphate isomerase [Acetobacteraceae bacterium]
MPAPDRFAALAALAARPGARRIAPLLADPARRARLTLSLDDLSLDLTRTAIDAAAADALLALAEASDLEGFRARLFAGAPVNGTERRAAMHMALRAPDGAGLSAWQPAGAEDAAGLAGAERARMRDFVTRVHAGAVRGATGQRFTQVVNLGMGGSDLGPRVVTEALTMADPAPPLAARFVANIDPTALAAALAGCDPARTLFLIASKSFTTEETAANAAAARGWIAAALGEAAVGAHFVALSTNLPAVAAFGIAPERVFGFRDWVGGRYSLWSPVGLVIALAAGWPQFQALLDGAWAMDCHFRDAPFAANLPVMLALAGIWHVNAEGCTTRCVLAYDERLRRLPAHLQQLEMESNGKRVTLDGAPVAWPTQPVIFGEPGTSAQHSFMQLVHQGPAVIPVDFILAAEPASAGVLTARPEAHRALAAHAIAQASALAHGRDEAAARAALAARGMAPAEIDRLAPHLVCPGDRPSAFILFRRLDAFSLGRLIALYEHKVAVQGFLWGINSFDQFGVELGKALAGGIEPALVPGTPPVADPAAAALIARFRALRGEA